MKRKFKSLVFEDAGFSLVELAIALLVMGLILGGILKGQELIESARLKTILTQVNEYRVATSIFVERYGYLPGDYNRAEEYISPDLKNGDGDGIISGPGLSLGNSDHESLSFWSHLAAANLISLDKQTGSGEGIFGHDAPATKLGGGFTIEYGAFNTTKHWFVVGQKNGNAGNGALLTPLQAMSLDQKIDSGNPKNGQVRAKDGVNAAQKCLTENGLYNIQNTKPACVVYFMM